MNDSTANVTRQELDMLRNDLASALQAIHDILESKDGVPMDASEPFITADDWAHLGNLVTAITNIKP